jgi:hypothetical protein
MKKLISLIGLSLATVVSLLALPTAAQASFNGAGYYYAGASKTMTGTDYVGGVTANVYVANPFVPNTPNGGGVYDHSLVELAVRDSSGSVNNAIELGIAVERNAFGDFKPRLFGYTWNAGVASNIWNGGPNWVDYAPNPTNLGADLTADVGTSKAMGILYATTGCGSRSTGWWVSYGGAWLGCYTDQAFGASFTKGTYLQAFGEYYYNGVNNPGTSNDKPCGDMGNGTAPGTGAAYVASMTIQNPSPATLNTDWALAVPTDSSVYDVN